MSEYKFIRTTSAYKFDDATSTFGFKMTPLVAYNFSDKFSLIAAAEFLSFGLSFHTDNRKAENWAFKHIRFGLAGKSAIFSSLYSLRIGFIYHFNKSSQ